MLRKKTLTFLPLTLQPHGLYPSRFLCPWGFSRQEYWSGLPCPPPGDLPNPGIKPRSQLFTIWATREAQEYSSGQPIPSPGDLPDPGIEPGSPALQANSLSAELSGKPTWHISSTLTLKTCFFFSFVDFIFKISLTFPTSHFLCPLFRDSFFFFLLIDTFFLLSVTKISLFYQACLPILRIYIM